MHEVAALLAAAAGASLAARLLRIPLVPLLLVAGVVLAYVAGPPVDFLEDALILGVSFLLFVVGLELDPRRARAQRGAAVRVGLAQFVVLAVLGYVVARALGFAPVDAGFVALALPASSTLVSVRLLQRRRQMFEPFGRLTLGVLLLQDGLVLLAIPFVTEMGGGWRPILVKTAGVVVLGVASLAVRRWVAPLFLSASDEDETLLLGALAILFLFIGTASLLDLPIVVGAFLAGVSLSRFPVNGIVRSEVVPIGDFFAAIFFTALGALVRLPSPTELGQALALILVVLLVTPPVVMLIAERRGFTSKPAAEAGLLLSQTSEISLVVVLTGMIQGQISETLFVVVAVVTLATMLLTPLIATDEMASRLAHLRPRRRSEPTGGRDTVPSDHVLLVGAGSTGMPLLEDLIIAGCEVAVIDDDPAIVRRLRDAGIRAIRGDATDRRVLERAGADRARVVTSEIRRPRDNAVLLEMARGTPVLVRVFEDEDARWVRERGGEPVLYSDATADGLIEWFLDRRDELERGAAARTASGVPPGGAPRA